MSYISSDYPNNYVWVLLVWEWNYTWNIVWFNEHAKQTNKQTRKKKTFKSKTKWKKHEKIIWLYYLFDKIVTQTQANIFNKKKYSYLFELTCLYISKNNMQLYHLYKYPFEFSHNVTPSPFCPIYVFKKIFFR